MAKRQRRGQSGQVQTSTPVQDAVVELKRNYPQQKRAEAKLATRKRPRGITINSPEAGGTRDHDDMIDA